VSDTDAAAGAAQAAAIAVQDAVDALRNATTLATVASGAAFLQFLETGDSRYLEALQHGGKLVDKAIADYGAIGDVSRALLARGPSNGMRGDHGGD
jgi:hypothetical protein